MLTIGDKFFFFSGILGLFKGMFDYRILGGQILEMTDRHEGKLRVLVG